MLDIEKRILELANRSYNENRYTFTDFLNISEMSSYYKLKDVNHELGFVSSSAFGGMEGCERQIIRFGDENLCGYEEVFPIVLLRVKPSAAKFADKLTHRDFLGSVIGLGLEREKLGDIFIKDNIGYIFVLDMVADYIVSNLSFVKHTKVKVEVCSVVPEELSINLLEQHLIVSSNRCDAIVAKIYNLSRESSLNLFRESKVYINGLVTTDNAKSLKTGDVVSIRGYGKFKFMSEGGITKKNRLYVNVGVYN